MKKAIGILCYPSVGGSGVVATELGMKLADRGHDVHFITSSIPFRLTEYRPNITVHLVEVNQYSVFKYPPYDITLASKVAEVIDLFDLEVHLRRWWMTECVVRRQCEGELIDQLYEFGGGGTAPDP